MLVKNATTSIKTNGFVSKLFSISRSCRQGCPVALLIYILQAEPMACAIRGNNDIKGIKFHDILLNFGFLWRALPIEIVFFLLA
jgi:hypothetical protein